jgi:hypothetical protein
MNEDRDDIEHIILDDELSGRAKHHVHPIENRREYAKLAAVVAGIFLLSIIITTLRGWGGNRFANDFMATFFITFAGFKFISIEEFALTYRTYDLISKELRPWPYAFPFIEAALGFGYFISTDAWQLNLITLLITGTAGYGVYKALTRKSKFMCACLGTLIRLPLTKVSLVENGAMFVMAAVMLFS